MLSQLQVGDYVAYHGPNRDRGEKRLLYGQIIRIHDKPPNCFDVSVHGDLWQKGWRERGASSDGHLIFVSGHLVKRKQEINWSCWIRITEAERAAGRLLSEEEPPDNIIPRQKQDSFLKKFDNLEIE